ncbi:MAG: alpha/beta hydrolase [Proteobacteria bacterium]|nr:alpha/beta hydrolase [Pseudomonadota bacterium]
MLWLLRKALGAAVYSVLGAFLAGLAIYVAMARSMPDLRAWHRDRFVEEFRADRDGHEDLPAYLEREVRLFAAFERWKRQHGPTGPTAASNRFNPEPQRELPVVLDRDWNRTVELAAERPRGSVLLAHGLTDSPYSMRALAAFFRERGFYVLALRLPGHGTIPGALRHVSWRDWQAAFRIAAEYVGAHRGDGPFWVVGYSTGGSLAIDYALRTLEGGDAPRPSRVVLLSAAIGVSPVAALARFQNELSLLPGLEKLAWTAILPEYDPHKYNSFPVLSGEEVFRLTVEVEERFERALRNGRLAELPPILAFQSVVDATTNASAVEAMFARLAPNGSELVLFDLNRVARAEEFLSSPHRTLIEAVERAPSLPHAVTVVTNANGETPQVVARTRAAGAQDWSEEALDQSWPMGVYSLSHVAVPFPPDDPYYGSREATGRTTLGSLEIRGERGVLQISAADIQRLRYNPFFEYVTDRLTAVAAGDGD